MFIKFRQLSDSADDDSHSHENENINDNDNDNQEVDDSLSMEFDPNMAPPSLSANSTKQGDMDIKGQNGHYR